MTILSPIQRALLHGYGISEINGSSAEENFERLMKQRAWEPESKPYKNLSKAFFSHAVQAQDKDDSDGSQSDEGVMVTPGTSDDGIKLVSSDDEDGGLLDGALARLELSERKDVEGTLSRSLRGLSRRRHETDDAAAGRGGRYFDCFAGFVPDNAELIQNEFDRLAKTTGWVQGSEPFRAEQRKAYASELQYFIYSRAGIETTTLARIQAFCEDIGIKSRPPSMNQCKKALDAKFVNIFDYIDCCRQSNPIQPVFTTRSSFRRYTRGKKVFPKLAVKDDPTLGFLLCKIFGYNRHQA